MSDRKWEPGGSALDPTDTDRPSVRVTTGNWTSPDDTETRVVAVRASIFGECLKSIAAQAAGANSGRFFSDDIKRAFQQGHELEDELLDWWEDEVLGPKQDRTGIIINRQHSVAGVLNPMDKANPIAVAVTGGLDEAVIGDGYTIVCDAKTMAVGVAEAQKDLKAYIAEKYRWQLLLYAYGLGSQTGTLPAIHVVVGMVDRSAGKLVGRAIYRYSVAELESYANAELEGGGVQERMVKLAIMLEDVEGLGEDGMSSLAPLAEHPCHDCPFECSVASLHDVLRANDRVPVGGLPEAVQSAVKALDDARRVIEPTKPAVKEDRAAKGLLKSWMREQSGGRTIERFIGSWKLKLSVGEPEEVVAIDAAELRTLLGDDAEQYITVKPGTDRLTTTHQPKWGQ